MEAGKEKDSLSSILKDKLFCAITLCVFVVSVGLSFIFDIGSAIAVLMAYFTGCIGVNFMFRLSDKKVPNLFFLSKRSKLVGTLNTPQQCTVCGNLKCGRHRLDLNIHVLKPWTDLTIPESVNDALEEILSLTLKEHIYSWYKSISNDEHFIQELRISLRFLISSILTRVLQVDIVELIMDKIAKTALQHVDSYFDIVELIMDKIAKTALQHVDSYLYAKTKAKSPEVLEKTVLNHYGSNMHIALRSRSTEVHYLRNLIEMLFPYCLPKTFLSCRSALTLTREVFCTSVLLPVMDIIADPDIINHLLLIFFDKTPMIVYPDTKERKVEILCNFATINAPNKRPLLQTNLQTILTTQNLLFPFMQFLKEEASVNILQFCLSVDDFNTRILNPDLKLDDMVKLQKEAQNMYNTYFAPNAVDRIKFSDDIVEEIRNLVFGLPEDVVKLRTTSPLYRAYDHAYTLLENTFCPMFHQSDIYYKLICGERWSSTETSKTLNRSISRKGNEGSVMTKLGHKIKDVFVPNVDEGHLFEEETGTDLAIEMFSDASEELYEEGFRFDDDPKLKTLSTWRVSIPRVETLMDQNCKYYNAFVIEVQRIDVREDDDPDDFHWIVKRRYLEFYVLEAKLKEFHGELRDIQLPPKRSIGNKGKQFLELRRAAFEKFLQNLLSLPTLQGSELLYRFLKSPVVFTTGFLPEINLGKMIKTVPRKLLKEKGQHLDPFLQTFISSTEASKPKPSKLDWKEIYDTPPTLVIDKLKSTMYNDNAASAIEEVGNNYQRSKHTTVTLEGIYDYLLFLAVRVYHSPNWLVQMITTFDVIIRNTVQGFVEWYLERKMKQVLKSQRIVEILSLLRDALYFDDDAPRTEKQKKERISLVLQEAEDFFPEFLVKILGSSRHEEGTKLLLSILQHPLLNKQLSYVLLDIIVLELFPELQQKPES